MKQTSFKPRPWSPTRGARKNPSEQLVAEALTRLGIDWTYEERFLPLETEGTVVRGMCPDYYIQKSSSCPEQYLEVTTAKQLGAKRRKARRAQRIYRTPVKIIDRLQLERIAADPRHLLRLLADATIPELA